MRLKKLILHGFKSFADRTEFVFDCPITGIVGPNGCGKSNVVDAVKWVLGEQSAKSLRGDAMMDVVFNGSATRKAMGMAEVILVFENPQRPDGSRPFALPADELAVGRRLFRDGTSEYQLNNAPARLKDVRELFLDTGIGVDAYSVIEQGRVAALLEANPEQRRVIIEEAAGISRFKARKKEAERKLEKVDQNLLRVNDIVDETERRLRSVRIQAGRARVFQEHSTRLTELRLQSSLHEYHDQATALNQLQSQREDAQFRLDDVNGDLASAQNAWVNKKESLESVAQAKQRMEYQLVEARAAIQSARQQQQYCSQQLAQIDEQQTGFEQDKAQISAKLSDLAQALEAENQALADLTRQLQQQGQLIEQRQQAFSDGQLQLNATAAQIEQRKTAILDLLRRLADTSSRLGAIEIERKNVAMQQSRLEQRRQQVDQELQALQSTAADLALRLDAAAAQITDQQCRLQAKRNDAAALGKQIAQVGESLGAAKEQRSGLLSRQALLQDLEAKREGVSEGVKSMLRQRDTAFPFIRGLVADLLAVDVENARVIEAALDGRDQWLITDDSAAALATADRLEPLEGRVNLLCADGLPPEEPCQGVDPAARPAIDLVRFAPADEPIARHLLGRTFVVEDLPTARRLLAQGPRGCQYVTRAAEVLADGIFRAGPLTAAMGLLSRRSELEALSRQIEQANARIEQLGRQLAEGHAQVRCLDQDISTLRNEIYQSNTLKVELSGAVAQNTDRQNALGRELSILRRELELLSGQTQRLAAEESDLLQRKGALETGQQQAAAEVDDLSRRQSELTQQLSALGEELTALRVNLGQVQEKQLSAEQSVQRHTAAGAELHQQIQRLERSISTLAQRRQDVQHQSQSAAATEAALVRDAADSEKRAAELAEQITQLGQEVSQDSARVETARSQRDQIDRELHELDLKLGEIRVRQETLVQRTTEELQLDLAARYAQLTAAAPYEPASLDWEGVAAEIKDLRDKIHRLGNVNVESIGEQDELEKRQQFLAAQVADLTSSKSQLEQLIDEINAQSSTRFEQTFNAVREHFQGMFRKLFGGGKADIYLETELDPPANAQPQLDADGQPIPLQKIRLDVLDAGIEIIAKPPGKQPVTISQLSGGEKAMTCVALLMSIFKSKPSPFCILDEVDAALDEANNQRFNLIVQEFLEQSQFIVITHSKCTMQIADVLYGVTMQEQGVSKRVAVKFDQIDAQGRVAEHAAA